MTTAARLPHRSGRAGRKPRALATVTAVVLIGIAAVAFVALTAVVGHDLRRTARARGEAQLRQLLLAGEAAAGQALDTSAAGPQVVPLPSALTAERASVSFTPDAPSGDSRTVAVTATFDGLSASQRLTYQRKQDRWVLVKAELQPTTGNSGAAMK